MREALTNQLPGLSLQLHPAAAMPHRTRACMYPNTIMHTTAQCLLHLPCPLHTSAVHPSPRASSQTLHSHHKSGTSCQLYCARHLSQHPVHAHTPTVLELAHMIDEYWYVCV
jgi:hypothetical protein